MGRGSSSAKTSTFAATVGNLFDSTNDTVDPDLVVIGLGTNDLYFNRPVAEYTANLRTIIRRYREGTVTTPPAPNASILLWIEPNRGDRSTAVWQQYVDAAYAVAASEQVGVVDVYERIGTATPGEFFFDQIHPIDAGHRLIADALGQALGVTECAPISGSLRRADGSAGSGLCVQAFDATSDRATAYARSAIDGSYTIWTTPGDYNIRIVTCAQPRVESALHAGLVTGGTAGLVDTLAGAGALGGRSSTPPARRSRAFVSSPSTRQRAWHCRWLGRRRRAPSRSPSSPRVRVTSLVTGTAREPDVQRGTEAPRKRTPRR